MNLRYYSTFFYITFLTFNSIQSIVAQIDSVAYVQGQSLIEEATVIYGQYPDSAAQLIVHSLTFFEQSKDWKKLVETLNICSSVFYYQNDFEKYRAYSKKAISTALEKFSDTDTLYAGALNNLSGYYISLGNYGKSIDVLHRSLEIQKAAAVSDMSLSFPYYNLGLSLDLNEDFSEAEKYFDQALQLRGDAYRKNPETMIAIEFYKVKLALVNNRINQGKFEKARAGCLKIINELDRLVSSYPPSNLMADRISAYQNLARISFEQKQYDRAYKEILKALKIQQDSTAPRKSFSYEFLGDLSLAQNRLPQALESYLKAIKNSGSLSSVSGLGDHARKHIQIARTYDKMGNDVSSDNYFRKALSILNNSANGIFDLEAIYWNDLYAKPMALEIIEEWGEAIWNRYQSSGDQKELTFILKLYESGIDLIKHLRSEIESDESKNILSSKTMPIYEGAIKAAYKMFLLYQDDQYLDRLFTAVESNKSQLLMEELNQKKALLLEDLPDSVLLKIREAQFEIGIYTDKLVELPERSGRLYNTFNDLILDKKRFIAEKLKSLEKSSNDFSAIKYNKEIFHVSDIQSKLNEDEAIIEYFVGTDIVYGFVLTSNSKFVFEVKEAKLLNEQVVLFNHSIHTNPDELDISKNFQNYSSAAFFLYRSLFDPAVQHFSKEISKVRVIPDGIIHQVPFEILLMKEAQPNQPYFKPEFVDYVLEDYVISYDYSVTIMMIELERERMSTNQNLLAYAPSFDHISGGMQTRACDADQLIPLQCAKDEVERIQNVLKGKIRLAKQATKTRFLDEASAFSLIHLATHACVDEDNAQYNRIFFQNAFMTNSDIDNLSLTADMIVLSACNTGSGQIIPGEGVFSLARGFVKAGAASSIVSRWSVDDCSTAKLMTKFYSEIKKGVAKDMALRNAKMQYLADADNYHAHPYFWAPFVAYGNMNPIQYRTANWIHNPMILTALAMVILIVIFVYFSRTTNVVKL